MTNPSFCGTIRHYAKEVEIMKILKNIALGIWCFILLLLMTGIITPEWKFSLTLIFVYLISSAIIMIIVKKKRNNNSIEKNECFDNIVSILPVKHGKNSGKLISGNFDFIENENIEYDLMSGEEFEVYVSKILSKMGFCNIGLTKGSGDQGVDIIAEKDRIKYAIQCKRYSNPVGNKAVQEIFAGVSFYHCHIGVVVTNNYFTNAAKELAYENGVVLWDKDFLDKYASLIEKPSKKEENSSYEMLNAEEKIVAIKNNKAGKVLYQYLLSSSRNALSFYLKNGDGTQCLNDMVRCIKKPIQLYNSTFNSYEKNICFTFYCGIHQDFRKTSYYNKLAKESEKSNTKHKDDLFEIKIIYNIENIVLEKGRIKIEYRPKFKMFTTTMEKMKLSNDIEDNKKIIYVGNKIYYKGYVTENLFPMKISNIQIDK